MEHTIKGKKFILTISKPRPAVVCLDELSYIYLYVDLSCKATQRNGVNTHFAILSLGTLKNGCDLNVVCQLGFHVFLSTTWPVTRSQFHQHFTCSFCTGRSSKLKKTVKSSEKKVDRLVELLYFKFDEIDPGSVTNGVDMTNSNSIPSN